MSRGKPLEAFDRYFAEDGVMYSNDELFASGKAECRAKQEQAMAGATRIVAEISECCLDVEDAICVFRNQTSYVDDDGEHQFLDGLHLQRWVDGMIAEERYYSGELMDQKIDDGILEAGDPLENVAPPTTAEGIAFRSAVVAALEAIVGEEQLEIAPEAAELLADELTLAGQEAHNPRHALKKLRLALLHSEFVEEVYADDTAIEDAFRRALGG